MATVRRLANVAACALVCALCVGLWATAGWAADPAPASAPAAAPAAAQILPAGAIRQVKILADKAADCSTLKSIVETVTRGCKTNDEKAVAIYNFMTITHFHRPYPAEKGGIPALKEINVYGWGLCGGLHATQSALWRELGWNWRFVGWSNPGHTTVEAEYDGKWHYLDVFLKFYAWMPDAKAANGRTIAGEDDLAKDTDGLMTKAFVLDKGKNVYYAKDNRYQIIDGKANWTAVGFLVSGDSLEGSVTGLKSRNRAGSPEGWGGVNHATGDYSTDVNLAPGFALTQEWNVIEGGWFWLPDSKEPPSSTSKDYRNSPQSGPIMEPYAVPNDRRITASGRLAFNPDFANDAFLKSFAATENVKFAAGNLVPADAAKPASVTVQLQSPYVLCKASGQAAGADKVEVSSDGGKTFKAVELKDFSAAVNGQYNVLVRVSFAKALTSLKLEALIQHNKFAQPYLSPGKNKMTVTVADAKDLGDNKLVVTYVYCVGSRDKSYEELCQAGKEVGKAHSASWSATPTAVRKVFAAKDLPATFDIDVPTAKDKFPVYPKMLYIQREVISPASKPLALPEGAVEPKMGAGDELKTLPNPYLIGTTWPAAKAE